MAELASQISGEDAYIREYSCQEKYISYSAYHDSVNSIPIDLSLKCWVAACSKGLESTEGTRHIRGWLKSQWNI